MRAAQAQTRQIDGLVFEVTPLGFSSGRRALVLASKILGPAVIDLLASAKPGEPPSLRVLRDVSRDLIARLSDDDLEALQNAFADSSRVFLDAKRSPFLSDSAAREEAFGNGRFLRFFAWLAFACEVNFGPFFVALGALSSASALVPAAGTRG